MAEEKLQPVEEDDAGGAPEWMVTFSDCMTLLLTFFVLLLSFASFDKETIPVLGRSFAKALPSMGLSPRSNQDSFLEKRETHDSSRHAKGSETPTNSKSKGDGFMAEKKPLDFKNLKVFSVKSSDFFYGDGLAINKQGRQVLDKLADFLHKNTGRIVISENSTNGDINKGINRALAIANYLKSERDIRENRFSITGSSTMKDPTKGRRVEITLLEKSIYE